MRPRIQYIAVICRDPETVAEYYKTYFGLSELGVSPAGDVSLTDGFYNLSLLRDRAELREEPTPVASAGCAECGHATLGLHHFGIAVDEIETIKQRLNQYAAKTELRSENGDLHHGEYRLIDPVGLPVSISNRQFGVSREQRKEPAIRHIALSVPKNDEMVDFYGRIFGFSETTTSKHNRAVGNPSRFVGDGSTALAILREPRLLKTVEPEGSCLKGGLNHFGFLVRDMAEMLHSLPERTTSIRPSVRPMAEHRTADPEGNPLDVSQVKGYEIDVNVWVRYPEAIEAATVSP
jgi:catechol 2,3-dioxygenase-like lactoylglutathione lyase family enzyme